MTFEVDRNNRVPTDFIRDVVARNGNLIDTTSDLPDPRPHRLGLVVCELSRPIPLACDRCATEIRLGRFGSRDAAHINRNIDGGLCNVSHNLRPRGFAERVQPAAD